jgi:hypothetical protein
MTRMSLYNPNSFSITIIVQLLTPSGGSSIKNIVLQPYGIYVSDNFLLDEFGYHGGAGIGMIASSLSNRFFATGEVYTDSPNGRYSTPLVGMFSEDRVPRSFESGYAAVQGLRVDSENRANFGCSNTEAVTTVVAAEISAWSGSEWNTQTVNLTLPPGAWQQQPVRLEGGWIGIRFRITSGGGAVGTYCYGVTVNNESNDGTVVPAQRFPPTK